tara:strand:+ start:113 stop:1174 length:1062 start_codon:yes stop_codon:yes gene_type:complete
MSNWGIPNRPKISNRVENRPIDNEGTDGDVQIKGTGLGAKLFAKWSGRWWDVPLSIDGITKIGTTDSDYLSIDRDSVDIYKNKVKVAEFGEDISFFGKIIIGDPDGTFSSEDNINIGNSQSGLGTYNVAIGYQAGESFTSVSQLNVCLGYQAGKEITSTGLYNVCIGGFAGNAVTEGDNNLLLGYRAGTASSPVTVTTAGNTICLGDDNITSFYCKDDSIATSDARDKTDIANFENGLAWINAMRPITYKWDMRSSYIGEHGTEKDLLEASPDGTHKKSSLNIGLVAQEVLEIEKANGYGDDNDTSLLVDIVSDGARYGLKYSRLTPILVKAVQELSAKLDTMQTEINNLKQG